MSIQLLVDKEKQLERLENFVMWGKDIISYKRFDAGKPLNIYLRDSQTGKIVATVFAGRKIAERIALSVNKEGC